MILTAVFDLRTNTFFNYFFSENLEDVKRIYMLEFLKKTDANYVRFSKDFDFYKIGDIDKSNGDFISDKKMLLHFVEIEEMAFNYEREKNK